MPGDGVKFKRGDLFRGYVATKSGVTYCAYGNGDKPKFYGWDKSLADESLWEIYDQKHNIWKLKELILDCGTLVFNDGEAHCRKLIPSYLDGHFVCRDEPTKSFDVSTEMTEDLDLYCHFESKLTTAGYDGRQGFPVPEINDTALPNYTFVVTRATQQPCLIQSKPYPTVQCFAYTVPKTLQLITFALNT